MNRQEALNILELRADASEEDIKKAYKKMAMIHHPDKNPDKIQESEEKFKQISGAYQYLTNPQPDNNFNFNQHNYENMEQVFRDFFQNRGPNTPPQIKKKVRPGTHAIKLNHIDIGTKILPIDSVLLRQDINFIIPIQALCRSCLGNEGIWFPCKTCNQTGVITKSTKTPLGNLTSQTSCAVCQGNGWKASSRCKQCKDRLVYQKDREVSFKLPKKFTLGQRLRLPNTGNENWKIPDSDLFITPRIDVPDLSQLNQEDQARIKSWLKAK